MLSNVNLKQMLGGKPVELPLLEDPWHEAEPTEIFERMRHLEMLCWRLWHVTETSSFHIFSIFSWEPLCGTDWTAVRNVRRCILSIRDEVKEQSCRDTRSLLYSIRKYMENPIREACRHRWTEARTIWGAWWKRRRERLSYLTVRNHWSQGAHVARCCHRLMHNELPPASPALQQPY